MKPIDERLRIEADPDGEDQQRRVGRELAEVQIRQVLVFRVLDLAEHRPLIQPQHVGCAENDAAGCDRSPDSAGDEHALQNQQLADETVQRRQPDRGHRHDQEHGGVCRHHFRQAAILGDQSRVPPLVDVTHQQEERAGRDPVVELLNDAPHDADGIERKHSEHDHGHVADARVGDEPLPVLLRHGAQRAVDDADNRQRHHHRHEVTRRIRKNWKREADEPVRAHLQKNRGQNHGAGCRRIGMRIGQPGVKWEHRHFDGEAEEECEEHPPLQVERHVQLLKLRDVERIHARHAVVVKVECEDPQQHHDAADEGVEEELDRRIQPAVAAPDADEEVHRHEHHFPKQEEQEEIEAHKRADHARLEDEQEDVVLLQTLGDRGPRRQDSDRTKERRQQDEKRAETVDAEKILRADRRDPRQPLDELIARILRVVPEPQGHRNQEPSQTEEIRNPPNRAAILFRNKEQNDRARQRQEKDQRQQRKVGDIRHGLPHEQIDAHKCKDACQHQQRVVLNQTGLHTPEHKARFLRGTADEIHGAIDDIPIDEARDP